MRSPTSLVRRSATMLAVAALAAASACLAVAPTSASAAAVPMTTDPAAYVNPFIGTTNGGNTFPGASEPFGMIQWSPVTTTGDQDSIVEDSGEYDYSTTKVRGFSLTHLSGAGCQGTEGDVPIMPYVGDVTSSPSSDSTDAIYSSTFSHANETAQPGYYQVKLDSGVNVQLATTQRTGAGQFTFPAQSSGSNILFRVSNSALGSEDASVTIDPATRTVSGWVESGDFCGSKAGSPDQRAYYKLYFVAQFDRPFADYGTWQNSTLSAGGTTASGGEGFTNRTGLGSGGYVGFDTSKNQVVGTRIGISYVSTAGALANLDAENPPGTSFAAVRAQAHRAWQRVLSGVDVGGGTAQQRTVFYTALYHALLQPNTDSDVTGQYEGADQDNGQPGPIETIDRRYQNAQYATFSGWDQYRDQVQLLTLVDPQVASDFAQSLLNFATQRGGDWDRWLDRNGKISIMEGDPSPAAVAGIYAFGGDHFDLPAAEKSLLTAATVPTADDQSDAGCPSTCTGERPDLAQYLTLHYEPATGCDCWGAAGETLEDSEADFGVGQLAADVGDLSTYRQFVTRSDYWQNLFNPDASGGGFTGYIQERNADGSWPSGFSSTASTGFAEGSSAQYTWMVYSNVAGLAKLMGGDQATAARLDSFFHNPDGSWAVTGSGGAAYYDPGNEQDLQTPWMYDYLGEPDQAQATVRESLNENWTDAPAGMPGNDDLGAMSSSVVWSDLGMYPYNPARSELVLASPLFPRVVIHRGNGVTITINASGAGTDSPYVQALTVNGQPTQRPWLPESFVSRGGTLDYTLSGTADPDWGAAAADAPPSWG